MKYRVVKTSLQSIQSRDFDDPERALFWLADLNVYDELRIEDAGKILCKIGLSRSKEDASIFRIAIKELTKPGMSMIAIRWCRSPDDFWVTSKINAIQ